MLTKGIRTLKWLLSGGWAILAYIQELKSVLNSSYSKEILFFFLIQILPLKAKLNPFHHKDNKKEKVKLPSYIK